ncbi:hypothetical protein [Actinomadura sp. 9N407]|uniref:hypothetical protein n=1 Tax=Actinomadura sp. 9N407 TaxID=3375154 RepID=UPI0037A26AEE
MISLKAALITATAAGAVAAGGVTWASVAQPEAAPVSANDRLPAAVKKAEGAAPVAPAPTCVPASELTKKGKEAVAKGTGSVPDVRQQAPGVKDKLPAKTDPQLPAKPEAQLPAKPDAQLPAKPDVKVPNTELPACPPDGDNVRKPDAKLPSAPKPGVPAVPGVPAADCDKLAPAVEVGGPVERAIMLPKGLKYASAAKTPADLKAKRICSVTQKWVSTAGTAGWVTVERLTTPAGMSEQRLRQAMKLPEGGRTSTVNGTVVWQAPAGQTGVLMFDPNGTSMFVNGSPVYSGGLQDLATRLAKATG